MVGARFEKELIRRSPESPRLEAIVLRATPTRRTPWQQSRRKVAPAAQARMPSLKVKKQKKTSRGK
jgi:hypothetical protein